MLAHCMANWDREYPAVTRAQLMQQRQEFWETRIEGLPEMWQVLAALKWAMADGDGWGCI
jgi:hypothetical protein